MSAAVATFCNRSFCSLAGRFHLEEDTSEQLLDGFPGLPLAGIFHPVTHRYFYLVKCVSSERRSCERDTKVCDTFIVRGCNPSTRKEGNMPQVIGNDPA